MKTLVYGWYEKQNCGDESYKLSFPLLFPEDEFTFTEGITEELIQDHDRIILGGGNILDRFHIDRLKEIAVGKKPIYAMSVGCTSEDVNSYEDFAIFSKIWARDNHTFAKVQKAGGNVEYAPDLAFMLKPDVQRGNKIVAHMTNHNNWWSRKFKLGVILNCHLVGDGQEILARDAFRFQQFSFDLAHILDDLPCNVYFIPFMTELPWDDRVPNGYVATRCRNFSKNYVVWDQIGIRDTLDIISAMDAVVSTRLHSSIFSCVSGVPFLDILHHDKNAWFLDTIDRKEWGVSYWDFQPSKAKELISNLLEKGDHESLREVARKQTDILKGKAHAIRFGE